MAEVEELGGAYVYLLSDAASMPVNGVVGICQTARCSGSGAWWLNGGAS
jgi:hypothetical protein